MAKTGRPKVPVEQKRKGGAFVALNPVERQAVEQAAQKDGGSVSGHCAPGPESRCGTRHRGARVHCPLVLPWAS